MTSDPEPDYVRPRTRVDGSIHLSQPDPRWADTYAGERATILTALGPLAVRVEHVGSTAVPGLAAKPIIDILLVVPDPSDEAAYVPRLEAGGYPLHLREPDWHQHRLFKRSDPSVNLHVFGPDAPEVERLLAFRDRLRASPDELERYQAAKRELAARHWAYVQDYADAKSTVVEQILARAAAAQRP